MASVRMNGTKTMAWTAALALLVGAAAPAAGQGLTAEVRGGPSFPAGDLAEVTDVGFNGGIGLGLWSLGERLTLRADGDYEMLNQDRRGNVTMPRTHLWHYQAGLELGLTDAASAWLIRVRAGAGGTTYDTNRFQDGSPGVLTSAFSVSGGLSVGRAWVGPMEMGILGRVFVAFLDRDRTARLAEQNPTLVSNFSKSSSVPVALYLRWRGMTP